ncbi:DNA replication complex GINS protein PSF1 [Scheffersomyces stipitis CBS 6054]|uniref:DNA replication complex GINS protein PSF1 n=1 Tax=Scheffersomyces stipitis (strain ATCC 58785 / CBS 6054 / NBRC 10063 / NRRL Y-11545) TaxID=322104 RepID=A3LWI1_PICST|nr:DNA replication complex GINS protein PSF1 [Scheffersomyces stipitis CBS 6054]ABN67282.2 DNA replication complex GINS protein PSF1 [Scheffersomyces stipitis CBS 6054]
MYGDLANKLILDAKRTANLSEIPLYQADLVKDIVKEVQDLKNDADYLMEQQELNGEDDDAEQSKINQCQLFVTMLSMTRNKRCLLAYENLRANKIDEFCWLNLDPITDSTLDNLSHAEQEYYKNYQDLLMDYKSKYADIDLSGTLEPPTNIFIDVRVLRNGGEVQTEYGSFNLIKDSQFYVRKSDVERLIQQGYLEEL